EHGLGVERGLDSAGHGRDVGRDAARLRRELADVGERGARPLPAPCRLRLRDRLLDVGIVRELVERDEGGRPLAEPGRRRRERRDHAHAEGELVLALHAGRPSMNCRTTGSSVCWIWATVPTCRILPSYNRAMRSPTV